MKYIIYSTCLFIFFVACNTASENGSGTLEDSTAVAAVTSNKLNLDGTEQIEFFFYPDPDNRKNFRQLSISDSVLINALRNAIQKDTFTHAECPHDVKMYLIRKGEVFKTVYGATSDSCRYFAYAINSNPNYTPMDQNSFLIIDSLRQAVK